MAKSRKKNQTVAQQVVGTAAVGLPAPLRGAASSKWGARLVVVAILALLGTGVATVEWDGWRPRLKIDRKRAEEVRHNVQDRVEAIAHHNTEQKPSAPHIFGGAADKPSAETHNFFGDAADKAKTETNTFFSGAANKIQSETHNFIDGTADKIQAETHRIFTGESDKPGSEKHTIGARIFKDHDKK